MYSLLVARTFLDQKPCIKGASGIFISVAQAVTFVQPMSVYTL